MERGRNGTFPHTPQLKEKDMKKAQDAAIEACSRMSAYRMPLGWSALPLFDEHAKIALCGPEEFKCLFRLKADVSDDRICELIGELNVGGGGHVMLRLCGELYYISICIYSLDTWG